jgi:environmental stress-induced protein Ves
MKVLRESGYPALPWKNGGGITREIHRAPADRATFDWRLSLATIDSPGPFSAFDGCARTLVLVRGAGIELGFGQHGHSRLEAVGQMASFDGGWQTSCELIDGPSTDLNLIVASERAESTSRSIQVVTEEVIQTNAWTEILVCCIRGAIHLTNGTGSTVQLAPVDVAVCVPSDGAIICRAGGDAAAQLFIGAVRLRGGGARGT